MTPGTRGRATQPRRPQRVAVIGGGLAGLTAALACADAGAHVVLVERRRRLGGLTWSFERRGLSVDNGQHVFLRCCHAYQRFLERIGSAGDVELQDRLDITVLRPGAGGPTRARLRGDGLPAPLHLARSLLGYRHLALADRLRLGRAVLPLRRLDLDDPTLDRTTFGAWLGEHGQGPRAVAALWDLITVPTVNLPAASASLAMGAKVFQTGLLTDRRAADIGWSRIPLGTLHGARAHAALEEAGVDIRLGCRVTGVRQEHGASGWIVDTDQEASVLDDVIVAVPHHDLPGLIPAGSIDHQDELAALGTSAVVDVHVVFDRPVLDQAFVAAIDSPAQWIFDRTASSGLAASAGRQYLAVSLSAADGHLHRHPEELVALVTAELPRLVPRAAGARVVDAFVTKERAATFRAAPGSARLRAGAVSRRPGLYLAGAWTDTRWPATMEGAVRSGQAAARAALLAVGQTRELPQEVA
ncbi:MAG: hydroxysqualene dehydroxylase HpnE [Acidimicrobiales bacterium]